MGFGLAGRVCVRLHKAAITHTAETVYAASLRKGQSDDLGPARAPPASALAPRIDPAGQSDGGEDAERPSRPIVSAARDEPHHGEQDTEAGEPRDLFACLLAQRLARLVPAASSARCRVCSARSTGRSPVSSASAPIVLAPYAAVIRSSNSSEVRRPSTLCCRRISTIRSRSASDARSDGFNAPSLVPIRPSLSRRRPRA